MLCPIAKTHGGRGQSRRDTRVHSGITIAREALHLRRCNRDVVANYLYPDEPFSPPTFRLEGREHLQGVIVQAPDLSAYSSLTGGN